MRRKIKTGARFLLASMVATLAACTGGMGDLETYIQQVKARPGGRIEPLPQVEPYESFVYEAYDLRSPFVPDTPVVVRGAASGPSPDVTRSKEFLEQFPLDSLKMVGTLNLGNTMYGLVQTKDGLVHRVVAGNYMGQNDGHITTISDVEIELVEIISDGLGGYIERPAAVALSD